MSDRIESRLKEDAPLPPERRRSATARASVARRVRGDAPAVARGAGGVLARADAGPRLPRRSRRRSSSGSSRRRSSSSARSSTSPRAASIGTSTTRAPHARRPSSGKASRATTRTLTYFELHREVVRARRGARRPRRRGRATASPSTWAWCPRPRSRCSRARASARPHSVVFGGFSAEALRDRINDCGAKVLLTQDGAWRRGSVVPLKKMADDAVAQTPTIEKVVVFRRVGRERAPVEMKEGRDLWWHDCSRASRATRAPRAREDARRRSTPSTRSSSSTRPARPGSRRASCTRPPATSPARTSRRSTSSISATTTSTGAPPTSAGSRATATSSTARSRAARRA